MMPSVTPGAPPGVIPTTTPDTAPCMAPDWLSAAARLAPADGAVLVTVAGVEGSGPREPGACMLVTRHGQYDTIGGGHLELCAIDMARAMLDEFPWLSVLQQGGRGGNDGSNRSNRNDDSEGAGDNPTRLERYALGPTLGQCCGGVVYLAFEVVDGALASVLAALHAQRLAAGGQGLAGAARDCWRLGAIDGPPTSLLLDSAGTVLAGASDLGLAANANANAIANIANTTATTTRIVRDAAGRRWLLAHVPAPRAHLLLFGAGHVGTAIVRALAHLPCTVSWIDEREELFPASVPANVTVEATDTPEALVAAAPPGASYLVLTHSHALDLRLAAAILGRAQVGWFGLIGSATKRVQFERRLAARGLPPARIAAMACPIGLPGIRSKLPAVIAASVSAQLLMVWEAQYCQAGQGGQNDQSDQSAQISAACPAPAHAGAPPATLR